MIAIEINEETTSRVQMVAALSVIAEQLEKGYSAGFDPDWRLTSKTEEPEED